ncbi:MAG: glycosyltransferase family 39 protein, partial [Planctomycetota bacterium]
IAIAAVGIIGGLTARVILPAPAAKYAYVYDHYDNIAMGVTARLHGLFKVYSVPVNQNPQLSGQRYSREKGQFVPYKRRPPRVTNYPPLGVTLFYLSSELFRLVDPSMQVNTYTSRLVASIITIMSDVVLAIAVWLVGRRIAGRTAALLAAVICWCFPPLVLDTSFWGQTDSWFLAPAVLLVWLMLRRRWIAAGAALAVACMLKPQGILLIPVAAFAALAVSEPEGSLSLRIFFIRIARGLISAIGGIVLISLPWTLADGFAWLDKSYVANFKMYADTTLSAFNLWYLDLLVNEHTTGADAINSQSLLMGVAKKTWGQLLVLLAMIVLAVKSLSTYRNRRPLALVLFSGLWIWSTFIFPTGVHERYIVYCIPLVILGAVGLRRLWVAVIILALIGTAELTHNIWLKSSVSQTARIARNMTQRYNAIPPSQRPPWATFQDHIAKMQENAAPDRSKYRPWEYLVAVASLGAYAWAIASPFVGTGKKSKKPPTTVKRKSRRRR